MASDVVGIFSATRLRKTVNDNKIVTPVGTNKIINQNEFCDHQKVKQENDYTRNYKNPEK